MNTNDNTNDTNEMEEEGRPPRDPKNGLYTFLSVLICVTVSIAYKLISSRITLVYALFEPSPSDQLRTAVYDQMEMPDLPEDVSLMYIRLHRNFDKDRMYVAFELPYDTDEEDFSQRFIPYQCGNTVEDQRFAVYPDATANAHYVYGNMYVSVDDPFTSCLIYEEDGRKYAVYSSNDYDHGITTLFDTEKIRL